MSRGEAVSGLAVSILLLVVCVAEVGQLPPIAPGINPDRAISAKGNDFAGCQSCDLFDLSILVRS